MEGNAFARAKRRKIVVACGLLVLTFAAFVPAFRSGAASSTPSSDLNDYVLYAQDTIQLKGGGTVGRSIINGNIGAGQSNWRGGNNYNEYLPQYAFLRSVSGLPYEIPVSSGDPHVILCQGSGNTGHINVNGYLAAPSVQLNYVPQTPVAINLLPTDPCQVPTAYASVLYKSPNMPTNAWKFNFTAPDIQLPALPSVTCDQTKNASGFQGATLPPGTYGTYDFNGMTTLGAGTYTFCNLTVEQNKSLKMTDNTIVNVIGTVDPFGNLTDGKLNLKGGASGAVGSPGARFNITGTVTFGSNGNYAGTFLAPNDDVALGNGTNLTGRVWALAMHSDWGINVTAPPPGTSTTTTSTTVKVSSTTSPVTTTTVRVTTTTTTVPVVTTTTTAPKVTTTTTVPIVTTTTTVPHTTTTVVVNTTTTTFGF